MTNNIIKKAKKKIQYHLPEKVTEQPQQTWNILLNSVKLVFERYSSYMASKTYKNNNLILFLRTD